MRCAQWPRMLLDRLESRAKRGRGTSPGLLGGIVHITLSANGICGGWGMLVPHPLPRRNAKGASSSPGPGPTPGSVLGEALLWEGPKAQVLPRGSY